MPVGVPSVAGWEEVTGEADFGSPDISVRYAFYVRPGRAGAYEVVRYRFAGPGSGGYGSHEHMQWDVNGRDLHRYECRGAAPAEEDVGPCTWQEVPRGGEAYRREVAVVLWIYSLHRRLREAQAAGDAKVRPVAPPSLPSGR